MSFPVEGGTLYERQHSHHLNGSGSRWNESGFSHDGMHMEQYAYTKTSVWVLLALSVAFSTTIIALRIYYQAFVARIFGRDDAVVTLSWVFFLAGVITTSVYLSKGRPTTDLSSREKEHLFALSVPSIIIYSGDYVLLKSSILLQYLRVFQPGRRRKDYVWWGSWGVIVVITLYYTISILLIIFRCFPPDKFWMTGKEGYCLRDLHMSLSSSAINLSTDVVMFLIPQGKIWSLRLDRSSKIKVSLLFSFALIAVGAAIARFYVATKTDSSPSKKLAHGSVDLIAWTEIAALFIYSCLPSILMFVQHLRRGYEPNSSRSSLHVRRNYDPYQAMLTADVDHGASSPVDAPDPVPKLTPRMTGWRRRKPITDAEHYMADMLSTSRRSPHFPSGCAVPDRRGCEPTLESRSEPTAYTTNESDVESPLPVPASVARSTGRRQPGQRAIISEHAPTLPSPKVSSPLWRSGCYPLSPSSPQTRLRRGS